MTAIAASSVQTTVAHIVARILERPPAAEGAPAEASPAPATPSDTAQRPRSAPPGRAAPGDGAQGRVASGAIPGKSAPAGGGAPAHNPGMPPAADPQPDAAMPQAGGQAAPANGAPPPTVSVILSALLSLANRAVPMDINLNQLLNAAPALKSPLTQLPPELLSKPGVIEAVVLRNTLLPSGQNPNAASQSAPPLLTALAGDTAADLPTNYRVALQWQNRVLQFISQQPLPTGRTVQLQIDARGQVMLLPNAPQARLAAMLASNAALAGQPGSIGAAHAQASSAQAAVQSAARLAQPPATAAATAQLPAALLKATPQQTLQQSLREALPRQQALHTLVPLLQKLLAPAARAQLPEPVAKQLTQLLQSLPKPAQLQTGEGLKRALENSGAFLEARIARSAIAGATGKGADPAADAPESLARLLQTDLKAQLTTLLGIVRKLLPNDATAQALAADGDAQAAEELVYDPKLLLRRTAGPAPGADDVDAADLQLAQLGKLLQSGLARIQMNQLDGAVARHASADPQLLVPTWVLELPLPQRNGYSDNLQLRIEQHGGNAQQAQKRVQWNVQISFDLHALGQIAAQLSIVDRNVAATVWAERAQTHRSVQDKIDYLRAGLESVGVRVTEMQCRLGLPPPRSALIAQQLVDVHT